MSEEAALLLDHAIGHADDPDVVEERSRNQVLEPVRVCVAAQPEPERDCVARDAIGVVTCQWVASVQSEAKRAYDLVVGLWICGHVRQPSPWSGGSLSRCKPCIGTLANALSKAEFPSWARHTLGARCSVCPRQRSRGHWSSASALTARRVMCTRRSGRRSRTAGSHCACAVPSVSRRWRAPTPRHVCASWTA